MHILLAHEYYRIRGGEDEFFEARRDLLRSRGIRVTEFVRRSDEIENYGLLDKAVLPVRAIWASDTKRELSRVIAKTKPDLAHFANTFPLISPSAYSACKEAGVPVVQNLENPRLMCPSGMLFRDGRICRDCVGKFPWSGIVHGCYHGSRAQTAVVAGMIGAHRILDTWNRKVDAYLVTSEFYIRKFVELGLPQDRIHYCPLAVPDPGPREQGSVGDYALYLGRLASEKGILTVLEAWKDLDIPLKIRGSGELEPEVRAAIAAKPNVELLPRVSVERRNALVRGARFLVWPSLGEYETCGTVVNEAYACGIPVVASNTGVAIERVADGRTGIFFSPNDPADLARQVHWAWNHPDEMSAMGWNGRREYERALTPDHFMDRTLAVYQKLIRAGQAVPAHTAKPVAEAHVSGQ